MSYTIECSNCKRKFHVQSKEAAEKFSSFKCYACNTPPDIMTAYDNVGKTMMELYGYCDCEDKKEKTTL